MSETSYWVILIGWVITVVVLFFSNRMIKTLIEDAAESAGASVNSWVLDALSRRARKPAQGHGFRMTHSFDL